MNKQHLAKIYLLKAAAWITQETFHDNNETIDALLSGCRSLHDTFARPIDTVPESLVPFLINNADYFKEEEKPLLDAEDGLLEQALLLLGNSPLTEKQLTLFKHQLAEAFALTDTLFSLGRPKLLKKLRKASRYDAGQSHVLMMAKKYQQLFFAAAGLFLHQEYTQGDLAIRLHKLSINGIRVSEIGYKAVQLTVYEYLPGMKHLPAAKPFQKATA